MIKIFSLKDSNNAPSAADSSDKVQRTSPAILRMQKDMKELDLPPTCSISHPNPDDLLNFAVFISPDDGYYRGGKFQFTIKIPNDYPHEPPKVLCTQKIYHPNVDLAGKVCLNILREEWKPVLSVNNVVCGLLYLFLEPNPEDPLNKEAAECLLANRQTFASNVKRAMRGAYFSNVQYDAVMLT
ncbi:NEDD8-conjugating enzyme Ubc12-like [Symsagittifera roscoffensis]|uniref:NEDD8-conjugating enzyme Ubc12-like n=1 Tax=Symsagittifera roscoffensis TaxID=84072 RepID=UPI00307C42B4